MSNTEEYIKLLHKEMEQFIDEGYDKLDQQEFEKQEIGLIMHGQSDYYYQNPDEYEKDKKIVELENEVESLREQLAEKDQAIEGLQEINQSLGQTCNNDAKEIERLREQLAEEKNRNKKLNHEAQKYYEDAYCNGFQNQKAIAELCKLKHNLIYVALDIVDAVSLRKVKEIIDQQIKELKGEVDV